jgi:hypothetical protein
MTALALVLGITCIFLIFLLVRETDRNKNLDKENDGLRHLLSNREINLSVLLKSGLPIGTIASQIAFKIEFMIESKASVESVLDICDDLGILHIVKTPVGTPSDIDTVRLQIQKILSEVLDQEEIETWFNSSRINQTQLDRLNASFFAAIKKSMLVWSPLY